MKRSPLNRIGRRALREQEALEAFRGAVLARGRCERCGTDRMLTAHHRLPRSRGGTHDEENGVCLCWRCHRQITDHACEDWREYLS